MKNKKAFFTTKWITYTAMLTALVIATCAIPPVYIPGLTGGVYWCDCIIIIAAFLLDPVASLVVGGVGTLFYDMVFGNAVMAPVSLLIHGLQAAVISVLLHFAFPNRRVFPLLLDNCTPDVPRQVLRSGIRRSENSEKHYTGDYRNCHCNGYLLRHYL